ncbi:MAG: hypothetical protein M1834_003547 [Cirrosporium novae-zelandiae]|nr:MAG: hypothetical protein M1834_003547 [Cirrosporium novae-zelandiae]
MAKLMQDWIGPAVGNYFNAALDWNKNPTRPLPGDISKLVLDEHSLRIVIDKSRISRIIQVTKLEYLEDIIQATISDGYTLLQATFSASAILNCEKELNKPLRHFMAGSIFQIESYEFLFTNISSQHPEIALLIQRFYLHGCEGAPTIKNPTPIHHRKLFSYIIQTLSKVKFNGRSSDSYNNETDPPDVSPADEISSQPDDLEYAYDSTLVTQADFASQVPLSRNLSSPRDNANLNTRNTLQRNTKNLQMIDPTISTGPSKQHSKEEILKLVQGNNKGSISKYPKLTNLSSASVLNPNVAQSHSMHLTPRRVNNTSLEVEHIPTLKSNCVSSSSAELGSTRECLKRGSSEVPAEKGAPIKKQRLISGTPKPPQYAKNILDVSRSNGVDPWEGMTHISRRDVTVPKDQEALLSKVEAWLPPLAGSRGPVNHVPVRILQEWNAAIDCRAQGRNSGDAIISHSEASEAKSDDSENEPNMTSADDKELDQNSRPRQLYQRESQLFDEGENDSSEELVSSWSSSPAPEKETLPPDSSNESTSASTQHLQSQEHPCLLEDLQPHPSASNSDERVLSAHNHECKKRDPGDNSPFTNNTEIPLPSYSRARPSMSPLINLTRGTHSPHSSLSTQTRMEMEMLASQARLDKMESCTQNTPPSDAFNRPTLPQEILHLIAEKNNQHSTPFSPLIDSHDKDRTTIENISTEELKNIHQTKEPVTTGETATKASTQSSDSHHEIETKGYPLIIPAKDAENIANSKSVMRSKADLSDTPDEVEDSDSSDNSSLEISVPLGLGDEITATPVLANVIHNLQEPSVILVKRTPYNAPRGSNETRTRFPNSHLTHSEDSNGELDGVHPHSSDPIIPGTFQLESVRPPRQPQVGSSPTRSNLNSHNQPKIKKKVTKYPEENRKNFPHLDKTKPSQHQKMANNGNLDHAALSNSKIAAMPSVVANSKKLPSKAGQKVSSTNGLLPSVTKHREKANGFKVDPKEKIKLAASKARNDTLREAHFKARREQIAEDLANQPHRRKANTGKLERQQDKVKHIVDDQGTGQLKLSTTISKEGRRPGQESIQLRKESCQKGLNSAENPQGSTKSSVTDWVESTSQHVQGHLTPPTSTQARVRQGEGRRSSITSESEESWWKSKNTAFKSYARALCSLKDGGGIDGSVDEDGIVQPTQRQLNIFDWKI